MPHQMTTPHKFHTPWGDLTDVPPLPALDPALGPLAAAIGITAANDNAPEESFYERAMKAPCGPAQSEQRRTEQRKDVKLYLVDEARRVVTGSRRAAYGTPEDNFARIAKFWQAYFENTGRGGIEITARDVSPLMRLMKEARLCESPGHLDSFVDIIGYTMTGAEVNEVEAP